MPINAQTPIELPPTPAQTFDKWWLRSMQLTSDQPKSETLIRCELMLYRDTQDGIEVCRIEGYPVIRTLEVPLSIVKAANPEAETVVEQILTLVANVSRTMRVIDNPPPESTPATLP